MQAVFEKGLLQAAPWIKDTQAEIVIEPEFLRDTISLSRISPIAFTELCLPGVVLREWQLKLFREIERRILAGDIALTIVVVSSVGAGKTTLAAILLLWVMFCNEGAKGITLAQNWEGVNNLLWEKIRKLYHSSVFPGLGWGRVYDMPRLWIADDWFATGLSAANEQSLRGHHSRSAAIRIIDEATSVPDSFRRSTQGILDAPFSFDLAISNPWTCDGWFYSLWESEDPRIIRARVTQKDIIAEGIDGAQEAWDRAASEYGEGSADFRAMYMAEFINADPLSVVNPARLDDCMRREPSSSGPDIIGVDVAFSSADSGGNESVISHGRGVDVLEQEAFRTRNTDETAERAMAMARRVGARYIRVDSIGVGAGVVSRIGTAIRQGEWDGEVSEFIESSAAADSSRFVNRAAEAAWAMCERINLVGCSLPNDPVLRSQCLQIRFRPMAGGKWGLEKTPPGKKSPDRFDSAMIATSALHVSSDDALYGALVT